MSPVPPPRRPAPASPASPVEASPVNPGGVADAPPTYHTRIIRALATLEQRGSTPTSARSLICEYYRHAGRLNSWPDFPKTLHEHPVYPSRSTNNMSKWELLFHAIGSTVKAYQKFMMLKMTVINLTPAIHDLTYDLQAIMVERLEKLETLVLYPIEKWTIVGDVATGYELQVI